MKYTTTATLIYLLMALAYPAFAQMPRVTIAAIESDGTLTLSDTTRVTLTGLYYPDQERAVKELQRYIGEPCVLKAREEDRYGRTRAILQLVSGQSVQEVLLQRGVAVVYSSENVPQTKTWMASESETALRPLTKSPTTATSALGKFALVKGRITRIYAAKEATYLNFGNDWKSDFSVTIPKRMLRNITLPSVGDTVRVRGIVHAENGPMITLTHPSQLELQYAR